MKQQNLKERIKYILEELIDKKRIYFNQIWLNLLLNEMADFQYQTNTTFFSFNEMMIQYKFFSEIKKGTFKLNVEKLNEIFIDDKKTLQMLEIYNKLKIGVD